MLDDENNAVLVKSMIDLGHNLGLRVVAEGVEDEPTWDHFAASGCDQAQGFYACRPLDASNLDEWLQDAHLLAALPAGIYRSASAF